MTDFLQLYKHINGRNSRWTAENQHLTDDLDFESNCFALTAFQVISFVQFAEYVVNTGLKRVLKFTM